MPQHSDDLHSFIIRSNSGCSILYFSIVAPLHIPLIPLFWCYYSMCSFLWLHDAGLVPAKWFEALVALALVPCNLKSYVTLILPSKPSGFSSAIYNGAKDRLFTNTMPGRSVTPQQKHLVVRYQCRSTESQGEKPEQTRKVMPQLYSCHFVDSILCLSISLPTILRA